MMNNWFIKVSAGKCNAEGECIRDAAIYVDGKFYFGAHHGDAINKAIADGVIKLDEEGHIVGYPGPGIHLDLFRTTKGRIIDRFEASLEFNFSGFA